MNSSDLLHDIQSLLMEPMCGQAPGYLGESADNVRSAVHLITSNLLGAVLHMSTMSPDARNRILVLLNSSEANSEIGKSDLAGLFGGGFRTEDLVKSGRHALMSLFGSTWDRLGEVTARHTRLRVVSSVTLLAMIAPFVLGCLKHKLAPHGEWIDSEKIDALAEAQKGGLHKRLNRDFFEVIGLGSLVRWAEGRDATNPASGHAQVEALPRSEKSETKHRSTMRWLPWLLAALLAAIALAFCMNRSQKADQDSSVSSEGTRSASAASAAVVASAASAAVTDSPSSSAAASTGGATAASAPAGTENHAASDVAAKSDASSHATEAPPVLKVFFGYGKSNVPADIRGKASQLLSFAQSNPSARFSIFGFTDTSGDPRLNEKLAKARAVAVRAALVHAGVDASRMTLKKPDGAPDSAQASDARRVEVRVDQ
ncbi:DUF937 domain-containing protein [Burkholderia ubonensis]|uniref:DUF937 domain-containing protein n=1 Tax=Burkholderia ubonensis TaxID=101571 RepID=UPI0018DF7CCD|nr:DUF937 domain-containing protein [Burkholderia ubonensis]